MEQIRLTICIDVPEDEHDKLKEFASVVSRLYLGTFVQDKTPEYVNAYYNYDDVIEKVKD